VISINSTLVFAFQQTDVEVDNTLMLLALAKMLVHPVLALTHLLELVLVALITTIFTITEFAVNKTTPLIQPENASQLQLLHQLLQEIVNLQDVVLQSKIHSDVFNANQVTP
jgi:hypothetical protein